MQPKPEELVELFANYQPLVGGRLNLAVSARGEVAGASGTSDDVSNALDRALLVELRRQADVIVTSGASVRAEKLRASQHAPILVLTLADSIVGFESILKGSQRQPVSLISAVGCGGVLREQLASAGFDNALIELPDLNPMTVWCALHELGYAKILFEFGPTLAKEWTSAGLVDEVCLTTTGVDENTQTELPDFIGRDYKRVASSFFSESASTRFDRFRLGGAEPQST